MSSTGAWQSHSDINMNPEALAHTLLVNVAQNLLSSQSQFTQNISYNEKDKGCRDDGRPSPWVHNNPPTIRPKPRGGMGLLGAPPDGDYRPVRDRDPAFVIRDQTQGVFSPGGHSGFGIGEEVFREKLSSKGQTEKSRKNYRPKIKEEGSPPNYAIEDFEHIHSKYFWCGLCDKKMWNSLSYVNHIKGNAHNKAVEDEIANEASKAAEARKLIAELIKNSTGKPLSGRAGICHMCGVRVKGDMLKHRKEDYHQKFKMFIHPHCNVCDADFEDRSEWHYHKFGAEHLNNIEGSRYGLSYDPMGFKDLEKVFKDLETRIGICNKDGLKKENNAAAPVQAQKTVKNQSKKLTKERDTDSYRDDEDIIIVDEVNVTEKDLEPIMQNAEILGAEFIKPVNGLFCKLCKKFFGLGDESLRSHCKTQQHLQKYREESSQESKQGTKRSKAAEFFSTKKKK